MKRAEIKHMNEILLHLNTGDACRVCDLSFDSRLKVVQNGDKRFWVGLYLALGWLVLVAIKPMIDGLSWVALLLLAIGGVVYSTGTIFYLMRRLKFRRAIWHGHVIGGAGLHYAAVLVGVVLAGAR